MDSILTIKDVSKSFTTEQGIKIQALDNISIEVKRNEFVCIVGPSGCGKSTLLRMLAGLDTTTHGQLLYDGQAVCKPRRELGMVFQEYSLLPWRTVEDNVALSLEFSGADVAERKKVAKEYLELVNLYAFAQSMPYELSGGMRQRVAIARALAAKPDVLLMDEPFGALDAHTRILLQKELLNIVKDQETTILFVTHSVDEAVYLADRVLIMSARPGRIVREISITMPHPRNRGETSFAHLTADILAMLDVPT